MLPPSIVSARTVVARLPDEPRLQQRWTDLTIPVSISSQPEGADVSVKGYSDAEDGWISIGRTPLAQARLPVGTTRIRVSKEGYAPFDGTVLGVAMTFALDPVATVPEGMIHMPGGTTSIEGVSGTFSDFWMDRFEISNKQFKAFVDAGGYKSREYWKEPFVEDGRPVHMGDSAGAVSRCDGAPRSLHVGARHVSPGAGRPPGVGRQLV